MSLPEANLCVWCLCTGTGFGLMHLCPYVMISHYFSKHRSLATGVATCGSGVGTFLFPALTPYLIRAYSWRGTMWVLGGIVLHGLVIGATYIPPAAQLTDILVSVEEHGGPQRKKRVFEWRVLQRPSQLIHMGATFCGLTGGAALVTL